MAETLDAVAEYTRRGIADALDKIDDELATLEAAARHETASHVVSGECGGICTPTVWAHIPQLDQE